ncbi:MAG: helix-turn-helix transcriptional regulator [Bacilli bacterium]|nr:helix-turn-helix transcriptional regulator [Bacilli bacterium]
MMTQESLGTKCGKVPSKLGTAFDYAVHQAGIDGAKFTEMFLTGSISKRLEDFDPAIVYGCSGIEIAVKVIEEATGREIEARNYERYIATPEYWVGYALAHYQILSKRPYAQILAAFPFEDMRAAYPTLHEADITKYLEVADERMKAYYSETNLKRLRLSLNLSQANLAARSLVNIRSIQMYEQRHKDINKASAETLLKLSGALHCSMEDLMERGYVILK